MPRLEELQVQLGALRRQNQELAEAKDRLEWELMEVRASIARGEPPLPNVGSRLVSVFAEAVGLDGQPRAVEAAEVRKALQVEPGDLTRTRELQQAIATLEVQGLIRTHSKGWLWRGKPGGSSLPWGNLAVHGSKHPP